MARSRLTQPHGVPAVPVTMLPETTLPETTLPVGVCSDTGRPARIARPALAGSTTSLHVTSSVIDR